MSIFFQVYGGCGLATLIGFLALCRNSAMKLRHQQPNATQVNGERPMTH